MAEGNESNSVRIKVILDTEEARANLARLRAELDAISANGNGQNSSAGNGIGNQASPTFPDNNTNPEKKNKKNKKEDGEEEGDEFLKVVKKGFRAIATGFGLQVASAFISEFKRSQNIELMSRRIHGTSQNELDYEQAELNENHKGASRSVGWTVGGMMAGGAAFGPYGMVAGAILGLGSAVVSTVVGKSNAKKEVDEKLRLRTEAQYDKDYSRSYQHDMQMDKYEGMTALNRMLQFAGTKGGRLDILERAIDDIESGLGEGSLKNLRAKKNKLDRAKTDPNDVEYQKVDTQINQQLATLQELRRQQFQEQYMTVRATPYDGSDVADSFAKKGLYAGAQIDIGAANRPIIHELQNVNKQLAKFLEKALDRNGSFRDGGVSDLMMSMSAKQRHEMREYEAGRFAK